MWIVLCDSRSSDSRFDVFDVCSRLMFVIFVADLMCLMFPSRLICLTFACSHEAIPQIISTFVFLSLAFIPHPNLWITSPKSPVNWLLVSIISNMQTNSDSQLNLNGVSNSVDGFVTAANSDGYHGLSPFFILKLESYSRLNTIVNQIIPRLTYWVLCWTGLLANVLQFLLK